MEKISSRVKFHHADVLVTLKGKPQSSDCEPINDLCEKLDKTKEDYEISYDDGTSEHNCYGYVVQVDW